MVSFSIAPEPTIACRHARQQPNLKHTASRRNHARRRALRRTMYAVIETGGKQYRVELGTELAVERLEGAPGTTISLDRVLLVADGDDSRIGTPTVADASVTADVVRQDRGEKIIVFKYRPKARHRTKRGHRQEQTVLRIADIRFGKRSAASESQKQLGAAAETRRKAREEAERKAAADQALAEKLAAEADKAAQTAEAQEEPQPKPKRATSRAKAATKPKAEAKPSKNEAQAEAAPEPAKPEKKTRTRAPRSTTKKDE